MALDTLLAVLPRPATPRESGAPDAWPSTEAELGIVLPPDYKEYINTFGTGEIGRFLTPFNPFSANTFVNLGDQIQRQLEVYREIREMEDFPYPLHPEPGGLLPWATTRNGDVLSWLTDGEPDRWSIVISQARSDEYEHHDEDMTGFLAKLITGEIVSGLFPYNFPDREALFVPGG